MKRLPVSVIIPTLDCRAQLESHLDASSEWLPEVEQIIAIDSNSSDGTLELLEKRLSPYNAEIIRAERGLYKCWNQALKSAHQAHVYYSTIGDTIDLEGLRKLHALIVEHRADVVISTPKIVDQNHRPLDQKWPVHYLKNYLESLGGVMTPSKRETWRLVSGFLPESIIGSSASNLYSTESLRRHPFPEDVGNPGDVYWALRYLPALKLCITSGEFAFFCRDTGRPSSWKDTIRLVDDLNREKRLLEPVYAEEEESSSLEHAFRDYQDSVKDRLIRNCLEFEEYVAFLSRGKITTLKEQLLTMTSVRHWIGRYLNSRNRVNRP